MVYPDPMNIEERFPDQYPPRPQYETSTAAQIERWDDEGGAGLITIDKPNRVWDEHRKTEM